MEAFSSPDDVGRRLAELDRALGTLIRLGYGVSLDLHPGDKLGRLHVAEPNGALELIDVLWRRLARRYADYPDDRLFLELLNEPVVDAKIWNAQAARLISTVRAESPGRTLIFGPANFQRIEALLELVPFPDPNIVYAAHFYDPMIFTHQGLDWSDDPLRHLQGVPFPADRADSRIVQLLSAVKNADAARLVGKRLGSRPGPKGASNATSPARQPGPSGIDARSSSTSSACSAGRLPLPIASAGSQRSAPPPSVIASAGPIGIMPTASASCVAWTIVRFPTKRSSRRCWDDRPLDSAGRVLMACRAVRARAPAAVSNAESRT